MIMTIGKGVGKEVKRGRQLHSCIETGGKEREIGRERWPCRQEHPRPHSEADSPTNSCPVPASLCSHDHWV